MTEDKKFNVVCKIVQQFCGVEVDQMSKASDLVEIGVNQLDVTDLLVEIEQEFDVVLPPDAYLSIRTIGDIMSYI